MHMQIRPVNAQELPELTALARSTYVAAYGRDMTEAALRWHLDTFLSPGRMEEMVQLDVFLLAEAGQTLIGFVQFGDARSHNLPGSDGNGAEIRRLYVLEGFQNRGIGGRLLTAALEHPRTAACSSVDVGVWHSNLGAQRFYARSGFVEVGEKPYLTPEGEVAGVDLILRRTQARG